MPGLVPPAALRSSRRLTSLALALGILALAGPALPRSQEPSPDEFTARVTSQLRAVNEEAALLFMQANEARDRGDFPEAERLYTEVRAMQPDFDHAIRRLCHVVAEQGRRGVAISYCREALAISDSLENKATLLAVLARLYGDQQGAGGGTTASEAGLDVFRSSAEARQLSRELVSAPDLGPDLMPLVCFSIIRMENLDLLRRCASRAVESSPDQPTSHYFAWVLAMSDGDFRAAGAALESAHRAGLADETYAQLKATTARARPLSDRFLRPGMWIGGIWLAGLLLLLAVGSILSRVALRAARRPPAEAADGSSGMTAGLRSTYRAVLVLGSLYYYLSIPLILALVVLVGGGLVYAMLSVGRIAIKLILIVVAVVLVTIWASLKGFIVRARDEDPGERLDLDQHPRLRRTLDEVAAQIGTRPVDSVYITPGTDLAVMERGGMLRKMRGQSERCLILGLGVLDGMKLGPFRAILGHEYGHFSNKDTAGGSFALSVRRSMAVMAQALAQGGAATWYSPAWIFLNAYNRIFLRISQGASRLQEILADRWAAFSYGAGQFEAGLRHVIERSIRFDAATQHVIKEVVEESKSLANLYTYVPAHGPHESEIATAVEQAIHAEPSPYDSHPAPATRFELVHALPGSAAAIPADSDEEVWSLFSDRSELQRSMTAVVRTHINLIHGIPIPGEDATTATAPAP